MSASVACILITTARRWALVRDRILPTVASQGFDEVCVVGDGESGDGYRHLAVAPITNTTIDALIKRDCGAVATTSDWLVCLSDDHALAPDFLETLRGWLASANAAQFAVFVPARYTMYGEQRIVLNNGRNERYCGGHGGIFARRVVQEIPWTTMPHHRLWDLLSSHRHQEHGFVYKWLDDVWIEDVEPEARPWE